MYERIKMPITEQKIPSVNSDILIIVQDYFNYFPPCLQEVKNSQFSLDINVYTVIYHFDGVFSTGSGLLEKALKLGHRAVKLFC